MLYAVAVFVALSISLLVFGVAAVGTDGNESPVVFPGGQIPRRR